MNVYVPVGCLYSRFFQMYKSQMPKIAGLTDYILGESHLRSACTLETANLQPSVVSGIHGHSTYYLHVLTSLTGH